MSNFSHALIVPDSVLAKEATDLLREHSTDLLFDHSMRVYLFAAQQGHQQKLRFDPELLYVSAAFHDFGLIKKFSSPDERFEVDGANAARQFLTAHKVPEEQVEIAWTAIALHTTPGVTQHMRPEVALLYSGVGLDVLGRGFDQFPSELREKIVASYPRKHFREGWFFVNAHSDRAGCHLSFADTHKLPSGRNWQGTIVFWAASIPWGQVHLKISDASRNCRRAEVAN